MKSRHLDIAIIIFILYRIEEREATNLNCGRRVPDYNVLIIDGFSSIKHWPWHAAIYHVEKEEAATSEPKIEHYKCGGTLINSNLILTAAHCVCNNNQRIDPESVKVWLGKLNLSVNESESQSFKVVNIIQHPDYNSIDQNNDIAIIQLATEAMFNNYVQPICLWDSNKSELAEVIGKEGTVIGWGVTETDTVSNVLQQAMMPVVPSLRCLASNRNFFGYFLSDKNFCAGNQNGTSVCNGDSGGSITFEENEVYYIRGIVSVSQVRNDKRAEKRMLCDPNEYVLFTDVAQYLPWIEEVAQDSKKKLEQVLEQGLINATCGRRLVDYNVAEGRWPWHAAIYRIVQEQDNIYDCGGTLINSKSILTVAHCLSKWNGEQTTPEEILVILGITNLNLHESSFPFFNVDRIVLHPKFIWKNRENNIAVIRLATEATFDNYVQPICLWESNKLDLSEVIGRQGTVIGWGITETGEFTNTLREESMPVISFSTCVRSNPKLFGNLLSDSEFCAGSRNGTIVCNGFSGGSMTFEENGVFYIRGIVSIGIPRPYGFCNPYEYVVFTDVAKYLHWIKQVTDQLEFY